MAKKTKNNKKKSSASPSKKTNEKASPQKPAALKNSARTKTKKRNTKPRKKTSQKSWALRTLRFSVKWSLVAGLWAFIFVGCLLAWYARELPDITQNATFERQNSIIIKAKDGTVLTRYGELKGITVSVDDLPSELIYAVLATEDRRFYTHFGVDPIGMARAFVVNISRGRTVQGGSTITQQLAKNLFLSHERTLKRKIQEAMLALWMERELSKDEILSAYLNRVYLGSGAYGIEAASQLYFQKSATQVNLQESAVLAGLFKAPSRYSPLNNPGLATKRANVVLGAMADAGYISKERAQTLNNLPPRPREKPQSGSTSRYFADWVVEGLDELVGTPSGDIIIETTLDYNLQQHAENVLKAYISAHGQERQIEQGAILFTRYDGAVLAMVGGKNYSQSQFNRATQAKRQPGSAFKPFVYLTALNNGWSAQSQIEDEPITEGQYRPENFGDKYYGLVNLETALTLSLNSVSVRLMKDVGVRSVMKTAKQAGIISKLTPDLSLALGSSAISMLEIVAAYGAIANDGQRVIPYGISRITDNNGYAYYERPKVTRTRAVLNSKKTKELKSMMQNVVENGTGRGAKISHPAAGKTGTSQNNRDAWFIGFTDSIIGAVWLGNDNNSPMDKVTGGSYPAQIWREVASTAQERYGNDTKNRLQPRASGFQKLMNSLSFGQEDEAPENHTDNARYNN